MKTQSIYETNSHLSINLSGLTRASLIELLQLDETAAFDFMYNQGYSSLTEAQKECISNDPSLYHCFDVAFHDICGLVRDDAFLRFRFTSEYDELLLDRKPESPRSFHNKEKATTIQTFTVHPAICALKESPIENLVDLPIKFPSDDEEEDEGTYPKTDDFFGTIQFVMKLQEMEKEESEVNKERLSDLCHVIEQQAATITNLQERVQICAITGGAVCEQRVQIGRASER